MRRTTEKNTTRRVAYGAVFAALSAVLLITGSVFELLDMTTAALASFAILVCEYEFGSRFSLIVYAASAILVLIFIPTSTSAIYYLFFTGYYPALKVFLDRKLHRFSILPKLVIFNLACTAMLYFFSKLYGLEAVIAEFSVFGLSGSAVWILLYGMLNLFFFCFDLLLTMLRVIYARKLRVHFHRH